MVTVTSGHDLSSRFAKSKDELKVYDNEFAIHAWEQMGGPESPTPLDLRILHSDAFIESGVNVSNRRNKAVKAFLDIQDGPEWLWFVDSDQVFRADTLHRMVSTAHANDIKVFGAVIPIITPSGLMSNCFVEHPDTITKVVLDPYYESFGEPGPKEFAATGCGCLLIHRDVLTAMREATGNDVSWFYEDRIEAGTGEVKWIGEDLSFCLRARQLGYKVVVDTSISVGHHKGNRTWWAEDIPDNMADVDAIEQGDRLKIGFYDPVSVVAVIPVKDKLELTKHVVARLRADPGVSQIVVLDNGSTDGTADWLANQDDLVTVDCPDFNIHEMWNVGIEAALADPKVTAVAILNNDLELGPEAMSECAKALAVQPQFAAVCPNYDGRKVAPGAIIPTTEICAGRYDGTGGLAGFAMVLARDFAETYRFPEDCTWWYGDNDLVLTAGKEGRKIGIVGAATVEHLDGGGQTGDWMSPEMQAITEADRKVFLAKWSAP
jgi:GT2 family glycosyltransferase